MEFAFLPEPSLLAFVRMKSLLIAMLAICNLETDRVLSQNKTEPHSHPLLCEPSGGLCKLPGNYKSETSIRSAVKPVMIIYYTDPICSACWGIEPQLRKLRLEYGNIIHLDVRMGGLLRDWNYNVGGIGKPSDVAHHWDEASTYYGMPIDGDVWLEDPLPSSYPPSIAFKAAQLQDQEKALVFLREIRESVFLHKKNITRWEHIEAAAKYAGLDIIKMKSDCDGTAAKAFYDDLKSAQESGISGFPTLVFADTSGNSQRILGSNPYESFEKTVLSMYPNAVKIKYDTTWRSLFSEYHSLTAKEFSELSGMTITDSERHLRELAEKKELAEHLTKNGSIWRINNKKN
jgi:predicted DsbA family dithiol-disulfide isomerase